MPKGPRIVFKDDRDSNIGRGAMIFWGHLLEDRIRMVRVAAQTAPDLIDNTMVVSEGWRKIRTTLDLHERCCAFDISLNQLAGTSGFSDRKTIGEAWAARIREALGPGYDVIVHGEGWNLHIHIELDP